MAECTGCASIAAARAHGAGRDGPRRSCHASAPARGDNAITRMAPIVQGWTRSTAACRARRDALLAPAPAVTRIASDSASLNAVPDRCEIFVDRRLTAGETPESAVAELRALAGDEAEVAVLVHVARAGRASAWHGKGLPAWLTPAEHRVWPPGRARECWPRPESGSGPSRRTGSTRRASRHPTLASDRRRKSTRIRTADRVSEEDLAAAIGFYARFPRRYAARA